MSKSNIAYEIERIRSEIQLVPIDHVKLDYCRSLFGNLHFIDPYFPPTDNSVYGLNSQRTFDIVWKRPSEFLRGEIKMFEGGIDKTDIVQGELGDCWLMTSLCSLANHPQFITRIFENQEYNQQNFYRLKICKDGEWQNVTIDDLIPCKSSTKKPIFSQNNGNELWVIILEKAYAKLFGSYLALKGGMAQESFEDLTGCPAFTFYFNKIKERISSGEFWRDLMTWRSADQCLLAATSSRTDESVGIVAGHYYTVINVVEIQGHQLLNLRNPWGTFEWKGAWSDGSREWTKQMISQLKPNFDPDDGQFWMSFEDFKSKFQRIVVGRLGFAIERRLKTLIKIDAVMGARPEEYFIIRVQEQSCVVVELHQEDERGVGVETYRPYLDLGFVVIEEGYGFYEYVTISQDSRERQIEMMLNPGTYLIVPLSGGNRFRKEENVPRVPLLTSSGEFHPVFQSVIKDIFRKYDKDLDQIMDCSQFLNFMQRIGMPFTDKQFYSIIINKYTSTNKGLTLQGFYEMFYVALTQYGEATVRTWLTFLGYDDDLYSIESRAIIVSMHSSSQSTEIVPEPMTDQFLLYAWSEAAKNRGQLGSKLSSVVIYTLTHEQGVSILLCNSGHDKSVLIDLSESTNVNYCIRSPSCEIDVPFNSWVIADHLQCKKSSKKFSYSISSRLLN